VIASVRTRLNLLIDKVRATTPRPQASIQITITGESLPGEGGCGRSEAAGASCLRTRV